MSSVITKGNVEVSGTTVVRVCDGYVLKVDGIGRHVFKFKNVGNVIETIGLIMPTRGRTRRSRIQPTQEITLSCDIRAKNSREFVVAGHTIVIIAD